MKMKKLVAVLAVVGMTGVMMAGCGSSLAAANTDSDSASQDQASDWDSSNDISIVSREDGSGTRGAFEEILGIEDKCVYANELDSTGAVMAKVASTPGAIGYISLDAVDDSVIALKLEGVAPSAETIKSGEYFLSRPFVMATKGEISEQNELVKALFDYVYSEEGQELAASVGLITVK